VNLREDDLLDPLNRWIAQLFAPARVDNTVAELLASQQLGSSAGLREAAAKRLADAEARLRRHQAAIEAGVEPVALVEAINRAHAEKEAARAELAHTPAAQTLDEAEIYAMIDSLDDVGAALKAGKPESLTQLYQQLRLELRYEPDERAVFATVSPRVVSECVRGAT
jgi:hypothetical protein